MRQLPQYSQLTQLKRLKASVSIDYLSINVNTINESFVRVVSNKKYQTSNRAFNQVEVFQHQEHGYTISSEKQFSDDVKKYATKLQVDFKYQITLNPSYFSDGEAVKKLLDLISPDISDGNHQISRLDISFALSDKIFSPLLVATMCHFKWKRTSTDFRQHKKNGKLSGIQCPGRSVSMSIYLHDLVKRSSNLNKHHVTERGMTIFELQLKKSFLTKVELLTVLDLDNFDWKVVFKKYAFYDLVHFNEKSRDALDKIEIFQDDVRTMGFHHARINYNRMNHRNFTRDIGKKLSPIKINRGKTKLTTCFRYRFEEHLKQWNPWVSNNQSNLDNSHLAVQSPSQVSLDNTCLH